MSHARTTVLLCACALVANAVAHPAPAPPAKKCSHKESKMIQQEKSFVAVKRIPIAYFYPFSLWPLPKYPPRDRDDSHDVYHYRRNQKNVHMKQNKR